jgi:hypothetical protein
MTISATRLEEQEKFGEEMREDLEAELAAVRERVNHLEGLLDVEGANSEKLKQRLGTERERGEALESALTGCEQMLTRLRMYAEIK